MGTTLAVMIGLLAPSAEAPSSLFRAVEAAPRLSRVGFSTAAAPRSPAWAVVADGVVADQEIPEPPRQHVPEQIPRPTRPYPLEDGGVWDRRYHEPLCACHDGAGGGQDGCCDGRFAGCRCRGRLPNIWRARCDLPPHQLDVAEPKTYYYFRAYTHIHTPALQQEAMLHGAPRENPYDTTLFAGVYEELSRQLKARGAEAQAETPADGP